MLLRRLLEVFAEEQGCGRLEAVGIFDERPEVSIEGVNDTFYPLGGNVGVCVA